MSFAVCRRVLQPAVVNISTKQRVPVRGQADPFEEFFRRFDPTIPAVAAPAASDPGPGRRSAGWPPGPGGGGAQRALVKPARSVGFIVSPAAMSHQQPSVQGAGGPARRHGHRHHPLTARIYRANRRADETSDLAVLKIDGRNPAVVQWRQHPRAVGDWVLAIGNPYGLGGTVTAGIISALHRGITGSAPTTATSRPMPAHMGNSGGPMFDLNGNVIGINRL